MKNYDDDVSAGWFWLVLACGPRVLPLSRELVAAVESRQRSKDGQPLPPLQHVSGITSGVRGEPPACPTLPPNLHVHPLIDWNWFGCLVSSEWFIKSPFDTSKLKLLYMKQWVINFQLKILLIYLLRSWRDHVTCHYVVENTTELFTESAILFLCGCKQPRPQNLAVLSSYIGMLWKQTKLATHFWTWIWACTSFFLSWRCFVFSLCVCMHWYQ